LCATKRLARELPDEKQIATVVVGRCTIGSKYKDSMPIKAYYRATISHFLEDDPDRILGVLTSEHHHDLEEQQRSAWLQQVSILKDALVGRPAGQVFLEFYIPRMGKRADAVLILENIVFVIEFKVGAIAHESFGLDQVEDYALDLKNFHEGSHDVPIVPVLVSTKAQSQTIPGIKFAGDLVAAPVATNKADLSDLFSRVCATHSFPTLEIESWISKGYRPTPTIVEAAEILYRTHSVADISRKDASAKNLKETTASVSAAIDIAREDRTKAICFVTGVPGSGKTLAGLNIATRRSDEHADEHAVFLSGNGPLVDVLREALARDKTKREEVTKNKAEREVRSFIQNIHHFRDHYVGSNEIPVEKVVVFDEAQRAWTREQATNFMQRKRNQPDFNVSEPEFLISVMDRHCDWCVIVCLVGGGQEIHTGEAGISEWINALESKFSHWNVHVSPRIALPEYGSKDQVEEFLASPRVVTDENLHLAVSMRSFRAESLSSFVGSIIDNDSESARNFYKKIHKVYPIFLTRDLQTAKSWLRLRARGSERIGLVASSGALRLRPEGIHIKAEIDPPNWFP
jgi:hypothetical protein